MKPAGLRSLGSVRSQIAVLKEHLGNIPLSGLEDPDEINRFKTGEYAEDVEIASVHRVGALTSGDELGNGSDAAVVQQVSVSPYVCQIVPNLSR